VLLFVVSIKADDPAANGQAIRAVSGTHQPATAEITAVVAIIGGIDGDGDITGIEPTARPLSIQRSSGSAGRGMSVEGQRTKPVELSHGTYRGSG
jgi:hypothetical protein